MTGDHERIHGIVDELVRQRRQLESTPGGQLLLQANGRAIAYWQAALARGEPDPRPGYTGQARGCSSVG